MDRRFDFSNERVKTPWFEGPRSAEVRTPVDHRVITPTVDVLAAPSGARDRQLLFNDGIDVLEKIDGYAFVRAKAGGFVGYVSVDAITEAKDHPVPDHWVDARMTHAYSEPDIKSNELAVFSMGTQLSPLEKTNQMVRTEAGWVPEAHISSEPKTDPVAVAQRLLGTPYLWGGNSAFGIDCSGLVFAAFLMCGKLVMQDSDLQREHDGELIDDGSIERGDLWFWNGHIAMVVDQTLLIHANAHHMTVVHESLSDALDRIGPTTARKRITLPSE